MDFDGGWAIQAGGWDARYAVALAVAAEGEIAAALIDTNGDGTEIILDEYRRDSDGGWVAGNAGGGAGESGSSWSRDLVAAYGRARPGSTVRVDYFGEHEVVANAAGWWLFIAASQDEDTMATVISAH